MASPTRARSLRRPLLRTLAVLIALFVVTTGIDGPSLAEAQPTSQQAERLAEARRLFERRSLDFPTIEIAFHENDEGCNNNLGYFRAKQRRLDICSDLPFVLIHELAHAWIEDNVSAAIKQELARRNGLPSWNDHSDEWDERGTEVAAHAIQQVVMRDLDPHRKGTQRILANYGLLTNPSKAVQAPF